jgi:FtsH-binding integral membrane protein
LLAGYVKLHMKADRKYVLRGILGYVGCSLLVLASVYASVELHLEDTGYFLNYNSPLALLSTFSLFVAVRNFSWKETRFDGLILKVAGAAFGVYLIHDNYLIRYLVWDTFRASKVARTHWAVIYAALIAVIVYLVCTCIELFRQRIFRLAGIAYRKTTLYRKEQTFCDKMNQLLEIKQTKEV